MTSAVSVVLGFLIGLEREFRSKDAGIRTHSIVCLGACLLMVVSRIGFPEGTADTARVAAQVIASIGFLGAGMIMLRKQNVYGLTTAAGIWTTAGIGMACGAGIYLIAVCATVLLIGIQCLLQLSVNINKKKKSYEFKISFIQTSNENEILKELFNVKHFHNVNYNRINAKLNCVVTVYTTEEISSEQIDKIVKENTFITSIERCDDE